MNPSLSPRSLRLGLCLALVSLAACAHCGERPGPTLPAHQSAASTSTPGPCPSDAWLTARGACVPKAWHCSPSFYASGDGCDCDCGVPDPDCAAATSFWCYAAGTPRRVAQCDACRPSAPTVAKVAASPDHG